MKIGASEFVSSASAARKLIAGIMKSSVSAFGPDAAVRIGCALQRPCGRRADSHDARADSFRLLIARRLVIISYFSGAMACFSTSSTRTGWKVA